jgi:hypothetical protein
MSSNCLSDEKPTPQSSATTDCPLPARAQTRNLILFSLNKSLIFLVGPLIYVGTVDAVLLKKLGFTDAVANLPLTAFFWTTAPFMVLCTWYFCQVRILKPILIGAYFIIAATGALTLIAIVQNIAGLALAAIVVRAILMSWCTTVVSYYEWEILARGVSESRRGWALSLAYGFGPALAVLGSLVMQLALDGSVGPWTVAKAEFPWDFAIVYGATLPVMGLASFLSFWYTVPLPHAEIARPPLVSGVLGGIGDFLAHRTLMLVTVVYLVVCAGCSSILPNLVLYTKDALGDLPERFVGYQMAMRFGFKMVLGFAAGWLLVRTNSKTALLATVVFAAAGLAWALVAAGKWYLVASSMVGSGELYCIYYQNYLISCSAKSKVRHNLAYSSLLSMPVIVMPVVYGALSDAFGLRTSLEVALALLVVAMVVVVACLPARPKPQLSDLDASDLEN